MVHPGDDLIEVTGEQHHGQAQQNQKEDDDDHAQNVKQVVLDVVPVDEPPLLPVQVTEQADDADDAVGKLPPEGDADAEHQNHCTHQQPGDLEEQLVQQLLIFPGVDSFTAQFDTPLPRQS